MQTAAVAQTDTSALLTGAVEVELRRISELPEGSVTAKVHDRCVILQGEVDWIYQRDAAELAARRATGVESVQNLIATAARTPLRNAEERLRNACFRDPQIDADHVVVTITGRIAVLTGHVESLAEKRQAGLAAWISPGVTAIENRLEVRPS